MANTQQLTTSISDFFTKLDTFLSGQGWSTHLDTVDGEFAAWKNPIGSTWLTLAVQWDTGPGRYAGVYQWHGQAYDTTGSTGSVPYDQDDDSGNGAASTSSGTLEGQRRIDFGPSGTGIEEFWCFEDTNYFHVVFRRNTDIYEHFGCGLLDKVNDWTGGEYCYGHARDTQFSTNSATRPGATILLDGLAADDSPGLTDMELRCATVHIEGMDEQAGAEKWGVVLGNQGASDLGTDRAAADRIHLLGGFRGGFLPRYLGQFAGTVQKGLVPLYPIAVGYWNRSTSDVRWPLGFMPDVRGVSIKNFAVEQEIVVGSDTWVVFPSGRPIRTTITTTYTGHQGIAYKKVS